LRSINRAFIDGSSIDLGNSCKQKDRIGYDHIKGKERERAREKRKKKEIKKMDDNERRRGIYGRGSDQYYIS